MYTENAHTASASAARCCEAGVLERLEQSLQQGIIILKYSLGDGRLLSTAYAVLVSIRNIYSPLNM